MSKFIEITETHTDKSGKHTHTFHVNLDYVHSVFKCGDGKAGIYELRGKRLKLCGITDETYEAVIEKIELSSRVFLPCPK